MKLFSNKYKKKYYPISSSLLDTELESYAFKKLENQRQLLERSYIKNPPKAVDERAEQESTLKNLMRKIYTREELTAIELDYLNKILF